MKLLIDSHTFLWFIWNDDRLSETARNLLMNPDNDILLGIASAWELAIKVSIGKLVLAQPFDIFFPQQLQDNSFDLLPARLPHLVCISTLPFHHKDPFDPLIIAQSIVDKIPIVSADTIFDAYGVDRIW